MKRFKNVMVGTSAEFATLTKNGTTDTTLATGLHLLTGMIYVNQDSGIIYILSNDQGVQFWVRVDNKATTGYNT